MSSLKFGSICSGIEAANVAWKHLGWKAEFVSEIEGFPNHVLHRNHGAGRPMFLPDPAEVWGFGHTVLTNEKMNEIKHRQSNLRAATLLPKCGDLPNYGDMTRFKEWPDHDRESRNAIDVLVGGTPCQSFSVAGLRKGLADPRGNLMLTFGAIAKRYKPRWIVWENVPGVLSSNKGRDFGAFLRLLGECGYGFAYRVLDAQYVRVDGFERAVPQRRRRVFVVGYLGDWRPAAAVLFEPEGMCGGSAPRRKTGQGAAPTLSARTHGGGGLGTDFDLDGGLVSAPVASTLNAAFGDKLGLEDQHINNGAPAFICESGVKHQSYIAQTSAPALTRNAYGDNESREGLLVAHSLRSEGFDASEDGTGRGTPIVPVAGTLCKESFSGGGAGGYAGRRQEDDVNVVAIQERAASENPDAGPDGTGVRDDGAAYTLEARTVSQAVAYDSYAAAGWAVRRLTPRECERLMGFPDDFTQIPWRGKAAENCPDGARYKALGNSMAVNVMRWIGIRIEMTEALINEDENAELDNS